MSDTIRPIRPTREARPTRRAGGAGKATSTARKPTSTSTTRKKPSTTKGRRLAGKPVGRRSPTFVLLLALVVVLNLIGLVMVLSASSVTALYEYGSTWYHFKRQVIWVTLGSVAMVVVMRVDYHRWRRYTNAARARFGLAHGPGAGARARAST